MNLSDLRNCVIAMAEAVGKYNHRIPAIAMVAIAGKICPSETGLCICSIIA
jgi:hypothetical protein